jgi:hypothetical protein
MDTNKSLKTVVGWPILKNNWALLLSTFILICLWQWQAVPVMLRALIMVPMYLSIACTAYVVVRNIYCRGSTDKTADKMAAAWDRLPESEQVKLVVFERAIFVLAAAIIIAGMLIIFGGFGGAGAAMEAVK